MTAQSKRRMDDDERPQEAKQGGASAAPRRRRCERRPSWLNKVKAFIFGTNQSEILRADYNRNFCRQLKSEFASFNEESSPDPDACARFHQRLYILEQMLQDEAQDERQAALAELFEVEMLLLRAMPEGSIRAKAWSTRATYRRLAGEAIYAEYLASIPPDAYKAPEARVRADVIDLTKGRHWWYLNAIVMEHGIRRYQLTIRRWLGFGFFWLMVLNVAIAIHAVAAYDGNHALFGRAVSVMLMALYAGMLGATVSIARRVKYASSVPLSDTDPVIRLSTIVNGDVGIQLSMIIGSTFALVFYFLCLARIADTVIASSLLPVFPPPCDKIANQACNDIVRTFAGLIPVTSTDLAKLLIWCFIAGFAEKFVPDIFDKLAHPGDKEIRRAPAPVVNKQD
jgi:hypothetical protein